MKTEKVAFISTLSMLLLVLLIPACTHKDYPSPIEQTKVRTIASLTKSVADGNTSIFKEKPKVITKEALDDILAKGFQGTSVKNINSYSLKTISEEGMPIIHSVNFNEGGWALVAGREFPDNQIIAYGEIGSFDPDNIESPEVRFWFRMTKASLKQTFEAADRGVEPQNENESYMEPDDDLQDSFSYDDPYVWVRLYLGCNTSNTITDLDHLTETKWGSVYPWNYKCPYISDDQCSVGCATVAVAQMLYYLHFHIGIPSGCYHSIDTSYTWNNGGYFTSHLTRSNYTSPSTRWNSMATSYSGGFNNSHKYVGDLMIDVADRLYTQFTLPESGAYFYDIPTALSNYNITCSPPQQYGFSQTISQLNASMPVIVTGTDDVSGEAHTWLIDGYQKQYHLSDYQYKWVTMPPDSLQYYNNINYDYVFTEAQMQEFYPDICENQIVHEYSASDSYLLRMNWGWSGLYNSGLYSILSSGWNANGGQFSSPNYILTGFTN